MDRIYKKEYIEKMKRCPYSGFEPMLVLVEGCIYTPSGHDINCTETVVDCNGCKFCGNGCAGHNYPKKV